MHEWVENAAGRTLVLLGAGASAPQLPVTAALTENVIANITKSLAGNPNYVAAAWKMTVARLTGTRNIEEFYSSLDEMRFREQDTTRFWVDSWAELPDELESHEGSVTGLNAFGILAHKVRSEVMAILAQKTESADKEYLYPLVQAETLGIVTLNYDLMVEKAASEERRAYTTGATEWDGQNRWFSTEPDKHVLKILKLHGSLNWRETRVAIASPLPIVAFEEVDGDGTGPGKLVARLDQPAIFGLNGKASPYDPYPSLRAEFDLMLSKAELLVVVGFSFADAHVSARIRRWLAINSDHKMIVVDPFFNASTTLMSEVTRVLCAECVIDGKPSDAVTMGNDRMRVIRSPAEVALQELFSA